MPWIHFTQDHLYRWPDNKRVVTSYLAGRPYLVKQECATLCLAKGVAQPAERPASAPLVASRPLRRIRRVVPEAAPETAD